MPPDKQYHRQVKAGQGYETMISQKKILVVEDNEINRMILRKSCHPDIRCWKPEMEWKHCLS